jgi:ornithine cyclodeaminase/alanine dehydrogenase-like protein (mu-crystallin family)
VKVIGRSELAQLLSMADAINALEEAFSDRDPPETPQRTHVAMAGGTLLLMPAHGRGGTGVKIVTVAPGNPDRGLPLIHGAYVLFAPDTLELAATIDGAALTALRTAAVSGLATRFLAGAAARSLVIFGAGTQGNSHLDAMVAVRPIESVTVVSRTRQPAEALAGRARAMGLDGRVGDQSAVSSADIVCTCTTSSEPLFDGTLLRPGTHINAVGAFEPHARELDDAAVIGSRVVVEDRTAALEEAGDLIIPIAAGQVGEEHIVADLREVVAGAQVRRDDSDTTLFKSVGLALEDLALARTAVTREGESPL